MDYLILVSRLFLSLVFFSSSIYKISNFPQHVNTIFNYQVLPKKYVKFLAVIGIVLEVFISLGLFLGLFLKISSILTILLLLLYIIFVSVNLLRGRNNISCGCGGIVGDKEISSSIIIRNLLFILIALFIYWQDSYWASLEGWLMTDNQNDVFSFSVLPIIFTFYMIALLSQMLKLTYSFGKTLNKRLG